MVRSHEEGSLLRQAAAVKEERAEDPTDQIRFVRQRIDTGHKKLFLKLLFPLVIVFALLSVVVFFLSRSPQ
jgi:hypothetical protein